MVLTKSSAQRFGVIFLSSQLFQLLLIINLGTIKINLKDLIIKKRRKKRATWNPCRFLHHSNQKVSFSQSLGWTFLINYLMCQATNLISNLFQFMHLKSITKLHLLKLSTQSITHPLSLALSIHKWVTTMLRCLIKAWTNNNTRSIIKTGMPSMATRLSNSLKLWILISNSSRSPNLQLLRSLSNSLAINRNPPKSRCCNSKGSRWSLEETSPRFLTWKESKPFRIRKSEIRC